jgi:hypothetical protein
LALPLVQREAASHIHDLNSNAALTSMQTVRRWVAHRGGVTACLACVASLVGIQISGYGVASRCADITCALILFGIAGMFHYDFIDRLSILDDASCRKPFRSVSGTDPVRTRIHLTITALLAFFFSALAIVTLITAIAG